MAVDPRQVLAGILTITMFVMLGNMIKRDHFDSVQNKFPGGQEDLFQDNSKISEQSLVSLDGGGSDSGPWKEDSQGLKPCWPKPDLEEVQESKGYVMVSLRNGPEFHVSQIADAVVVAKSLGATLVLPDIRGNKPGETRHFREIYNVEKFVKSLDGVVRVAKEPPEELLTRHPTVVKIPNRLTQDQVLEDVEPVFRKTGHVRVVTHFSSVNMKKRESTSVDSVVCLAMFGALELQPEVQEVVNSMVGRLRTLSRKSDGRFIAVDLRVDILEKKGCQSNGGTGTKGCYSPQEIAEFLMKIGFDKDTTIYLTQTKWHSSLDALKDVFPKTYTKESIMPVDKKGKFLGSDAVEFEEAIDFNICSQSDVFVPAISGLFYANVAGKRIASGRTEILVPAQISGSSAPASKFLSTYVTRKNHFAYSCFC
ncbi:GDP-fucose protein O-fucosyltransferase [Dillenia turbinata]|uniref:O-fucosyltransferase family protein n=1 Tax=Dillenia turbinata TaxID=194707 RepID=A0AAN8USG4_9MAGN